MPRRLRYSDEGRRRCQDTFISLQPICRKLRIFFWLYLAYRLGIDDQTIAASRTSCVSLLRQHGCVLLFKAGCLSYLTAGRCDRTCRDFYKIVAPVFRFCKICFIILLPLGAFSPMQSKWVT